MRQLWLQLRNFNWAQQKQLLEQHIPALAGATTQLQQLLLSLGSTCRVTWAGQLPPSLRELGLRINKLEEAELRVSSSLIGLTQLTKLTLGADWLAVDPKVQLPPSIRTLAQYGRSSDGGPLRQVAGWGLLWLGSGS